MKSTQTLVQTNPNLLILQSRLFNPSLYAAAKWVIIDVYTKKNFLITDFKLLNILQKASAPIEINDLINQFKNQEVNEATIYSLINSNIIKYTENIDSTITPVNYTKLYQLANYNYPFRDYADPDWLEKDLKLMDQYKQHITPPSIYQKISGQKIALEKPDMESSNFNLKQPNKITEKFISNLLFLTLGRITLIKGPTGPLLRRTSPSGGGRHPSEGIIIIKNQIGDIAPGVYTYDTDTHSLVRMDINEEMNDRIIGQKTSDISILLYTCHERAMWRYRDIRAFRPMLIDIGHITETFRLLAAKSGCEFLEGDITEASQIADLIELNWMKTPAFKILHISSQETDSNLEHSIPAPQRLSPIMQETNDNIEEDQFLTNPFSWFSVKDGSLYLNVVYPETKQIKIDLDDFNVLTHCLPSQRGDRVTNRQGISEVVINKDYLRKCLPALVDNYGLLPKTKAEIWYNDIKEWTVYGWYPSLLQHANAISASLDQSEPPLNQQIQNVEGINLVDLETTLVKRKTVRSFDRKTVRRKLLDNILDSISPKNMNLNMTVYLAIFDVESLSNGLYKVTYGDKDWSLEKVKDNVTREKFQELAIGQYPASAGSFSLILVNKSDIDSPVNYEEQFMSLGKIGQRICLIATRENLGAFMTPAIKDKDTFEKLGIPNPELCAAYLFSIGVPKGEI